MTVTVNQARRLLVLTPKERRSLLHTVEYRLRPGGCHVYLLFVKVAAAKGPNKAASVIREWSSLYWIQSIIH
jgi:hypothetical protein